MARKMIAEPNAAPNNQFDGPKKSTPAPRGGDRKSQDFHLVKAHDHIVKAIGRRLASKDK